MVSKKLLFLGLLIIFIIIESFLIYNKTIQPYLQEKNRTEIRLTYINCLTKKDDLAIGQCLRQVAKDTSNIAKIEREGIINQLTASQQLHWCHEFLHYVGWDVYQQTNSLPLAFSQASEQCDSGMFHGVVEGYISQTAKGKFTEDFIKTIPSNICTANLEKLNLPKAVTGICYHGLGHAFMFITDNNLITALHYCDTITSGTQGCYSGAFMENVQSKQVGLSGTHPSKFAFDPQKPDFPCNTLDDKYKSFCYTYKGIHDTVLTKGDFRHAFLECQKIDQNYRSVCIQGVGMNIPAPQLTSEQAGKGCLQALVIDNQSYELCVNAALSFEVELHHDNMKEIEEFCQQIESNLQSNCYYNASLYLKSWLKTNETIESKCQQLSNQQAINSCLQKS
jgi:hypothetical protein